ncbi:copper chaperone CopZ [Bacillus vallismortis]|uniref:Copper chaperone CopZ n=1 Tax=Bacillus vallismortis TaxID=72361 RepID=A0AAP3CHV3_BACVA|nr:copper chaperone CopZ [Bacillus vallismortis]MBG9767517.1 copper resistance protein CopZ [Bacillus vallismortis]MCI3986934.1 copper chaperone CopZ [Bacillus vallismortis]MCI4138458.1 copper chaperone CopZ [Bacillus vallismortis]MCY7892057.1 copper chaperone CopZ [Bacillus vallismortis]MCY7917536.1 copper chaperone CopZ [Bacillus vallismortis]
MEQKTLHVEGMSCQHCVKAVKTSVGELDGVSAVDVNLEAGKVDVSFDAGKVSVKDIADAIEDQGYDVAD